MFGDYTKAEKIYIACAYTECQAIDSLAYCSAELSNEPFQIVCFSSAADAGIE